MTGRECLQGLLRRERPPRLLFTTLVDDQTRSVMPEPVRALPVLDFYRRVGCDILQFGNYGLPGELAVSPPCLPRGPELRVEHSEEPDGTRRTTVHTEWGVLNSCYRKGHPTVHPIATLDDLRLARRLWEHTRYEGAPGHPESYARAEAALGDDGIYVPTLSPSPVQQLLELDMGLVNFYGLLQDYPSEVEGLLEAMQQARLQEWRMTVDVTPAPALIPVENTSSTLISPALYRRYSLPQLREVVEVCHGAGKLAVFHMCGWLRDLLPAIRETGLDGINAATPPPHGDTTVEQVLDACGEDFLVLGGILDGSVFQAPRVTREQLHAALEGLYTPRVRRANLLLWLPADGLPTSLERFELVQEWFARQREPS